MVLDTEGQHASRWQAAMPISAKIGCTPQTLNDSVKKADVDRRLIEPIGNIPPTEAETNFYAALETERRAA